MQLCMVSGKLKDSSLNALFLAVVYGGNTTQPLSTELLVDSFPLLSEFFIKIWPLLTDLSYARCVWCHIQFIHCELIYKT